MRCRTVTAADRLRAVLAALSRSRIRITPGQARAILNGSDQEAE